MYEDQKKLISLLSQSRLSLQRTVWQRLHHSSFILHHYAGQTASLPLQGMRQNVLVPPPMFNLIRYHGLLSPAARWRSAIVPFAPEAEPARHDGCSAGKQPARSERPKPRCSHPRNYSWAELMKRVWEVDVLECPCCRGRMRILAAIHSPDAIRGILECLGLPTRAPPIYPALRDEEEFLN
jgi:hypothetical protein